MRCVFANATFTGGHATARSHENRSRGVVLSCRVRWHMRGGMRVPYHARAPQQREQRSRFGHWNERRPCTDLANHLRGFTRDIIAQPKPWEDFALQSTGGLEWEAVVAKRHHGWPSYYAMYNHSWRPSSSENNFLSRNLAEPVADARLCCARAPAHRHVAPRRPGSEFFTWRRLRCPKGSCIGKRGEGRWWVRSPANSRTSFSEGQKDYRKIGTRFR